MSARSAAATIAIERGLLCLALLFFLAPAAWLFAIAYEPARDIFNFPPRFVFEPTLDNFRTIFGYFDVARLVLSSLTISLGATTLSLLLGVPAGYALARSTWRYAPLGAYFFLAVRMVPPVATLIPFYLEMRDIALLGTYWAVILLDTVLNSAFVIWMMYSYFRSLPKELEEAALADGCTQIGAFLRVALPLVVPGLIASALFCIILSWNDFLFPAFLTNAATKPLSVALLSAYGTKDITWGTMGALSHFLILPIVAIALLLNRYFVTGLTRGIH
ncbi:MAG: carbohydrate ABC transporter permease [Methylobacteriaceae bacterium]|nr:carbohydrate ABC transporter permease [Methylobacteriaceae bacterium]